MENSGIHMNVWKAHFTRFKWQARQLVFPICNISTEKQSSRRKQTPEGEKEEEEEEVERPISEPVALNVEVCVFSETKKKTARGYIAKLDP